MSQPSAVSVLMIGKYPKGKERFFIMPKKLNSRLYQCTPLSGDVAVVFEPVAPVVVVVVVFLFGCPEEEEDLDDLLDDLTPSSLLLFFFPAYTTTTRCFFARTSTVLGAPPRTGVGTNAVRVNHVMLYAFSILYHHTVRPCVGECVFYSKH